MYRRSSLLASLLALTSLTPAYASLPWDPFVFIDRPGIDETLSGALQISGWATGTAGIASLSVQIDGQHLAPYYGTYRPDVCQHVNPSDPACPYVGWEAFLDTTQYANGVHTIAVWTYDWWGRWGSSSYEFRIENSDTQAPSITLTGPAHGSKVRGKISLTASASDAGGIAKVRFFVDGLAVADDSWAPYSHSWSTTGVADGSHAIRAQAFDHAGNTAFSAQHTVTVDNTGPSVAVTAPAAGAYVRGVQTVSASASDASGVVYVQFFAAADRFLGQDSTSPYSATWDTTIDADGQHWVSAIAKDGTGNSAVSTAVWVTVDNTPPSVTLTDPAHGAAVKGNVALTATAADNLGVANVRFLVDGAWVATDSTAPYAFTWSSAGVADGSHTIRAQAFDKAGNAVYSAQHTVTVDNAPPSVTLTAPAHGGKVRGKVSLTATASDADGVANVRFFVDGVHVATDSSSPYAFTWSTTGVADGSHVIRAQAFDTAGNAAYSAQHTVTVDNTPPSVAVTAPAAGAYVRGVQTVSASASDASGVAYVQFFAAADRFLGQDTTSPYTASWDTTIDADGQHWVQAIAKDGPGNSAVSTAVWVTVDNTPPSVTLTGPANGAAVRGNVVLTATAADNLGVANVRFLVDGASVAVDSTAPYAFTWSTAGVADGSHVIRAQAFDRAGNAVYSAQHTVTVDNASPAVTLTAPSAGSFLRGVQTVSASATDAGGVKSVQFWASDSPLGDDTISPYSASWDTTAFADGQYGLVAIAQDHSGNSSVSTAAYVTVDNTPPTISLTAPAQGATVSGDVGLAATASDNLGVADVRFFVDGVRVTIDSSPPYAFTWNSAGAADGSHVVRARAFDRAGNATYSAQHTVTVDNLDFSLSFVAEEGMDLSTRGVEPGDSATIGFRLTRMDGSSAPVALSVAGLPAGVTASLPSSLSSGQTATLQLTASATASEGAYPYELRGTDGGETMSLPGILIVADLPNVSSVTPDRVSAGAVETVTIRGTDFEGATVWVATEKPFPEAPDRIFPLVTVLSGNPEGTELTVQVDATTPGVDGFYNLIVQNAAGGAAAPIEVLPDRPVVYMFTPSQPAASDLYVFSALGANLAGASVSSNDPEHVRFYELDNSSDSELIGFVEFLPGAAPDVEIFLANAAGQTALPLQVESSEPPDTVRVITSSSSTGPDLLLQQLAAPFVVGEHPFGGPPPGFPKDPIFRVGCGGRIRRGVHINYSYRLSDLIGRTGKEVLEALKQLPLGSTYELDLQLLETVANLEVVIRFICSFSQERGLIFTDIDICINGSLRIEVIGVSVVDCSAFICTGGSSGGCESDSLLFPGSQLSSFITSNTTSCTEPTDVSDEPQPPCDGPCIPQGDRDIDVKQAACCADTLNLHISGISSTGLLFDLDLPPIQTDVDESTCEEPVTEETEYLVYSWIDETPGRAAEQGLRLLANEDLVRGLNRSPVSCVLTLGRVLINRDGLIRTDRDRQYINAFGIAYGGDSPPPLFVESSAVMEGLVQAKNYRQLGRMTVRHDGRNDPEIVGTFAGGGRTKDPCRREYIPAIGPLAPQEFSENGLHGNRKGHAWLLNSFRVGREGQIADQIINGEDCRELSCAGMTTPWIWSVIRVDRNGELRSGWANDPTLDTQIFNTFTVYRRRGDTWQLFYNKPQSDVEEFIALDSTSNRRTSQIP